MGCSLCGAEGVNSLTCPFNSKSANPKPERHNKTPNRMASSISATMTMTKPKPKPEVPKPVVIPSLDEEIFDRDTAEREARRLFPKDKKKQDEYVSDTLGISLKPLTLSVGDQVLKTIREKEMALKEREMEMVNKCKICLTGINNRHRLSQTQWGVVSKNCSECSQIIGELYHNPEYKKEYKKHHRGKTVSVDDLARYGEKDNYYNSTMYEGAKFWSTAALERALPKI